MKESLILKFTRIDIQLANENQPERTEACIGVAHFCDRKQVIVVIGYGF